MLGAVLGDVDVKVADRIGLELAPVGLVALDLRQTGDVVTLQAAMRDERIRCGMVGCRAYKQSSSGSTVCRRKATMIASSSTVRTVDLGSFDPVRRSSIEACPFHLATALGLYHDASPGPSGSLDYAVSLDEPPLSLLRSRGVPAPERTLSTIGK